MPPGFEPLDLDKILGPFGLMDDPTFIQNNILHSKSVFATDVGVQASGGR